MKIPVNWLRDYIDINKDSRGVAESFTMLGLLLDKPIEHGKSGDDVLDLEHRMDRADWLSIIGCARDLAAYEQLSLKYPERHTQKGKEGGGIKIDINCEGVVNRFNTRVFKNIKVGESPNWLKQRLEDYGIPSKNNIVDITNFVMVEYGQPMHAQDINKMEAPEIVIRMAKDGEEMVTLLGETIKLDKDTFVLTQNNKPTVIGGIVGGIATSVDGSTTNIVLDAGNYNQINIRRTSRRLKIQNETVLRYDKFLHPDLTQLAIERATHLILELAGGEYYENYDYYPKKTPLKQQKLRIERLEQLSGMNFTHEKVKQILENLEYRIIEEQEDSFEVEVPLFRTDVEVEDDLVADILRINGYDKIPNAPIDAAPPAESTPRIYKFENKIRKIMIGLGLHEHITDPLIPRDEKNAGEEVELVNALSQDKNALRKTIYQTLKPVTDIYKKHKIDEVGLFEVGKTYMNKDYSENRLTEIVYYKEGATPLEISQKVKSIAAGIYRDLGLNTVKATKKNGVVELSAEKTVFGEIKYDSITLYNEELMKLSGKTNRVRTKIVNNSYEDLSLVMPINQEFGAIYKEILDYNENILDAVVLEEYIDSEKLEEKQKAVLVRVKFVSTEETAKTKNALVAHLKDLYGVELR